MIAAASGSKAQDKDADLSQLLTLKDVKAAVWACYGNEHMYIKTKILYCLCNKGALLHVLCDAKQTLHVVSLQTACVVT